MSDPPPTPTSADPDRRRPRSVYGVGSEPDPRFTFANERTFLAWIRTGLGFLAAGVAIATLADLRPGAGPGPAVRLAAIALIGCGLICGIGGLSRWARNERSMRLNQPLSSSPLLAVVTGALVLVAIFAFVAVSWG